MALIPEKIRTPLKSFSQEIKSSSETTFLALLILRMFVFFEGKINWTANEKVMLFFGVVLQYGTMLGCAGFLIYIIIRWKQPWKTKVFFLVPAVILLLVPIILNTNGDNTWYQAIMDLFFCLVAYGKNYKKILWCYMGVAFASLAVAALGLPLGLTQERGKIGEVTGFSLGIIYPNTWGQIAFLILISFWYLFLQRKKLITLGVFLATAVFMYLVPECKTIALLAAVFPFFALLIKPRKQPQDADASLEKRKTINIGSILLTIVPFICLAITLVLCWQMDWVKRNGYPTPLASMAMRFVQGGMAFRHYGFPLIGHSLPNDPSISYMVGGWEETLYVVDNAFVTFGLFRGALWMLWALCWLSYANWKSLKNRDRGLVLISAFIMAFALMERPGLEASYNFLFLYPLASVAYLKEPEEKFSLRTLFGSMGNQKTSVKPGNATKKKHKK